MITGHCNSSFLTHDTSKRFSSHHARSFSQPSMMPTQALQRRPVKAGVYASVHRAGYSGSPYGAVHPTHLPTPGVAPLHAQPSPALHEVPEFAHTGFLRRHSSGDALGAQRNMVSPLYSTPNYQSAPAVCGQSHPDFSLAPSGRFSAAYAESAQGLSQSGSDGGGYFHDQSSTPSDFPEDYSMSDVTPSPEPFSVAESDNAGPSSQTADYLPSHEGISPASPWSPSLRRPANKVSKTAMGLKNPKNPRTARTQKDPRAAKRLEGQRKTDAENIQVLWDLFVRVNPQGVLKKDRLGLSRFRPLELSFCQD